ncbi:hypothetical protein GCM10011352_26390 [Marinobacterium zhoushanense]|uniref:Phosphate:Na+ symporter n=1 Tax=Marinobacterium zhoushanense TaxID=1679163 RepID=A0ABQ1KK20_9GAMM|nr:Na/Pi symporter [Marinobacterium zhoushanense]GGB98950.1 hypothetical protein GCM10011352_26390 [Marinobacterium zhoushanense]
MDLFVTFFAGLGLFFIGLRGFANAFNNNNSRFFHSLVKLACRRKELSALIGTVAGAITQSGVAVAFVIVSMASTGTIQVRRAVPLIGWANVGTTGLVLVAAFDIHLLIYLMLGVVGLGYYLKLYDKERFRFPLGVLLGLGLLLLGLAILKGGAGRLNEVALVSDFLSDADTSLLLLFLAATLFGTVAQSSATAAAIAVTCIASGLFTMDQALVVVFGANLGSAFCVYFLGRGLTGSAMQMVLMQVWSKALSVLILLPVLVFELYTDYPGIKAFTALLVEDPGLQLTWASLLIQVVGALTLSYMGGLLMDLAEIVAPQDRTQTMSRPKYLFDQALNDPESALGLVGKEQSRLVGRLPLYFDGLRADATGDVLEVKLLHPASISLAAHCRRFISELTGRTQSAPLLERVAAMQSRNELLVHMLEGCRELQVILGFAFRETAAKRMRDSMTEGLHALLLTLEDSLSDSADDCEILLLMSSDRSGLMERLRGELLESETSLSIESRRQLFAATTLFERLVWQIHNFAQLLARSSLQGELESEALPSLNSPA